MLRFSSRRCVAFRRLTAVSASPASFPFNHNNSNSFAMTKTNEIAMSSSIRFCSSSSSSTANSDNSNASPISQTGFDSNPLHKKLHGLINQARIVVFLTGTPEQPRCGFTVRMVELLEQLPIKYTYVNIMEDDEVCEGLKTYSQWPTYPQLYIDGELIGGWDITRQMVIDGTLIKELLQKGLLEDEK